MKSVSIGSFGLEMFTRRTATVTISAPEASTAAAFSSRLLYLPVPTISREVKVRPATVHVSACDRCLRRSSAASDEAHDLVIVAVLDLHFAERRARHDLEIALDRNAQRVEAELADQLGDADALATRRCSPLMRT